MSDDKATCRFCGHRYHRTRMFHWFGDVWECRDLLGCEAAQRLKSVPVGEQPAAPEPIP